MKAVQKPISVVGIVNFTDSPHTINKKAYELTLKKYRSNEYRSEISFNLFNLPLGEYTMIVEFFPPEMNDISVVARGAKSYIAYQNTTKFTKYSKTLVKLNRNSFVPPDYIYIFLQGKTTKSDTTAHIIVYGVKGITQVLTHLFTTIGTLSRMETWKCRPVLI